MPPVRPGSAELPKSRAGLLYSSANRATGSAAYARQRLRAERRGTVNRTSPPSAESRPVARRDHPLRRRIPVPPDPGWPCPSVGCSSVCHGRSPGQPWRVLRRLRPRWREVTGLRTRAARSGPTHTASQPRNGERHGTYHPHRPVERQAPAGFRAARPPRATSRLGVRSRDAPGRLRAGPTSATGSRVASMVGIGQTFLPMCYEMRAR